MSPRAPADPAALAARLGARAFGAPPPPPPARWWTLREVGAALGYSAVRIQAWLTDGWAADLPRRRGPCNRILLYCAAPPPPPSDRRRGRLRRAHDDRRAAVIAAVVAAGGPPRQSPRGKSFWRQIGAQVGLSESAARQRWKRAERLGEVPQ